MWPHHQVTHVMFQSILRVYQNHINELHVADLGRSTSPPGDVTSTSLWCCGTSRISSPQATKNHFFQCVKTLNLLNIWTCIPWNRWFVLVLNFENLTVFFSYKFKTTEGVKSEGLQCLSSMYILWIQQMWGVCPFPNYSNSSSLTLWPNTMLIVVYETIIPHEISNTTQELSQRPLGTLYINFVPLDKNSSRISSITTFTAHRGSMLKT
jgi:hypothetical protein